MFLSGHHAGLVLVIVQLSASALATNELEAELHFHRAVQARNDGRLDEAKQLFERVLAADPNDVSTLHYLGLVAMAQDDPSTASDYLRRAHNLTPDDAALRLDLAAALLGAGSALEALPHIEDALTTQPENPRTILLNGIANYRLGEYESAVPQLARAASLDPSLTAKASYYIGLCHAYLGNLTEAESAFGLVEGQSPRQPLANAASLMRDRVVGARPRPWNLSLTAGSEYDTNPRIVGENAENRDEDFRGVFRLRGSYQVLDSDRARFRVGYDGYLSVHADESDVDLNTQSAHADASLSFDPARFSVRYDFAYSWLDGSTDLVLINRVTPAITFREGDLGSTRLFYFYQNADFKRSVGPILDQDSQQHVVGLNQFLFLNWGPLAHLRAGAIGDFFDPQGREFRYDGVSGFGGLRLALPFGVDFDAAYEYVVRDYKNASSFDPVNVPPSKRRGDRAHRVDVELSRGFGEHVRASATFAYRDNRSNIPTFDYERIIVGAYVTFKL